MFLLAWLLEKILFSFKDQLWLDASSLNRDGRSLLIAGPSHAGKTTLVLAASLSQKYKILSEDITFVSSPANQLTCLTVPLSLRPGTVERVEKATGKTLPALIFGEWVFLPELYENKVAPASLQTVLVLEPIVFADQAPLMVAPLPSAECLKRLLPISNALRLENGIERLIGLLADAQLFSMSGGSLEDRLYWLSANNPADTNLPLA